MDVYADSVVRRVRYCATDPDGAGSTADCANNLFLLQQCARDACDEPRRSDPPRRYGTPYQARYLPQKSVHSLPDAVIFVHPRFRHFYAALRVSTRKPAAHTKAFTGYLHRQSWWFPYPTEPPSCDRCQITGGGPNYSLETSRFPDADFLRRTVTNANTATAATAAPPTAQIHQPSCCVDTIVTVPLPSMVKHR